MGAIAALTAALCWAIATRIYRGLGSLWSPLVLTFIKSVLAIVLFALSLVIVQGDFGTDSRTAIYWLIASGAIGIGLGDTALFKALMSLGESRTLVIAETFAPIFVVIAAWFFLNEQLSTQQIIGMLVVIVAVDMVVGLHASRADSANRAGISWAVVAAACQAVGVIISRDMLVQNEISAEASALWRLIGGLAIVVVLMLVRGVSIKPKQRPSKQQLWKLFAAVVVGTFIALWGLQLAIQLLPAGIAQTLLVTCALIAAVIAACRGEKLRPRQWLGLILGLPGVALVVL